MIIIRTKKEIGLVLWMVEGGINRIIVQEHKLLTMNNIYINKFSIMVISNAVLLLLLFLLLLLLAVGEKCSN